MLGYKQTVTAQSHEFHINTTGKAVLVGLRNDVSFSHLLATSFYKTHKSFKIHV